jgi:hypothetical protein
MKPNRVLGQTSIFHQSLAVIESAQMQADHPAISRMAFDLDQRWYFGGGEE